MQLRPLTRGDLDLLDDIDATVESAQYLHLVRDIADDAVGGSWRLERRPLTETLIEPNRLTDDARFAYRQLADGIEEGVGLVLDGQDPPVLASCAAIVRPDRNLLELADLRVDYDHRREGFASVMLYQVISFGRERGMRAVYCETRANNVPAQALLAKTGFELGGLDERRRTNHDLLKEATTLLWYLPLEA